jgi:hypothetical protein
VSHQCQARAQTFSCHIVPLFPDGGIWGRALEFVFLRFERLCFVLPAHNTIGSWSPGDALRHWKDSVLAGPDHGIPAGE